MKRLFDLTLSAICLILLGIPMAVIGLTVRLVDGHPAFFCQTRIGRQMRPFRLYKFRTMRTFSKRNRPLTVGDDPRITRLGHWLRKHRLDELPQLFNIFLGEMSFVGPRPEVPEFVVRDDPIQQQVCQVRPGLFDGASLHWLDEEQILAQVEDWEEYYRKVILPDKLVHSLNYIKTRSVKSDIRLLWKAFILIAFRITAEEKKAPHG